MSIDLEKLREALKDRDDGFTPWNEEKELFVAAARAYLEIQQREMSDLERYKTALYQIANGADDPMDIAHIALNHPDMEIPCEIRYNNRLDLEPAWLAKACDTVREKGLNEKSTLEYVAAEAIREYLRHIFPFGNIMPQNDKKQQNVTDRELLNRLGEIQEYAGQFFGCRCDQEEDCAPGDCWPCRMVTIANMANPDDEELPMREYSAPWKIMPKELPCGDYLFGFWMTVLGDDGGKEFQIYHLSLTEDGLETVTGEYFGKWGFNDFEVYMAVPKQITKIEGQKS